MFESMNLKDIGMITPDEWLKFWVKHIIAKAATRAADLILDHRNVEELNAFVTAATLHYGDGSCQGATSQQDEGRVHHQLQQGVGSFNHQLLQAEGRVHLQQGVGHFRHQLQQDAGSPAGRTPACTAKLMSISGRYQLQQNAGRLHHYYFDAADATTPPLQRGDGDRQEALSQHGDRGYPGAASLQGDDYPQEATPQYWDEDCQGAISQHEDGGHQGAPPQHGDEGYHGTKVEGQEGGEGDKEVTQLCDSAPTLRMSRATSQIVNMLLLFTLSPSRVK